MEGSTQREVAQVNEMLVFFFFFFFFTFFLLLFSLAAVLSLFDG
jgi:hypothetical protein